MTEASGQSRDKRRTRKVRGLASQLIHGAALRASRRAAPWAAAALWRCCRDDRPASPCSSRCCSGSSAACSTLGTSGVWKHKNIRGSNAGDKDVGESVRLKRLSFSDRTNRHWWWCVAMNYGTSLLQCLVWFTCIIFNLSSLCAVGEGLRPRQQHTADTCWTNKPTTVTKMQLWLLQMHRLQRGDLEGKSSRLRSDSSRNQVWVWTRVSDISFKNVPHRTRGGVSRGLGRFLLRVIWVISRLIDGAAKSVKQLLDGCETHRSSRVMSTPTDGVAFRVSEISVQKCFMTSFRDVQPVCM